MNKFLFLEGLARFADVSALVSRLLVGSFLVWGVWDNVSSADRMAEFVAFIRGFGVPAADVLAPLSVYVQLVCGVLLLLGLLVRWAGLLIGFNFGVGFMMVHLEDSFRGQFPALVLIAIGVNLASSGGGRYSLDRIMARATGSI